MELSPSDEPVLAVELPLAGGVALPLAGVPAGGVALSLAGVPADGAALTPGDEPVVWEEVPVPDEAAVGLALPLPDELPEFVLPPSDELVVPTAGLLPWPPVPRLSEGPVAPEEDPPPFDPPSVDALPEPV